MPERDCIRIYFRELTFRFYFDADGMLHALRYGAGVPDALETFFEGQRTWNDQNGRWESRTDTHVLYWAWYGGQEASGEVVIISSHEVQ